MAKKRKTAESSKANLEPPQLAVMKNGGAAADSSANAKAEKMSPPASKRKKTAKKSVTPAPDSESGANCAAASIRTSLIKYMKEM